MHEPIIIISVVRDYSMYDTCIRLNPFANGHTLFPIDNTILNKGIPASYNEFFNTYNFSSAAWFIFCHEDFEIKEDIKDRFSLLNKNVLYGPIGVRTDVRCHLLYQWKLLGHITESNKDGSHLHQVGQPVPMGTRVETFDCQCLIVHSDLIKQTGLRFDEQLSFDLYIEDFCIQAKEKFNVLSAILPFDCQHWSSGNVKERYHQQEEYLNNKYYHCCYTGTSSYSIGRPPILRRLHSLLKNIIKKIISRR